MNKVIFKEKYVSKCIIKELNFILIYFKPFHSKILKVGENIKKIDEKAYMVGINWEVFFKYYFNKNEKKLIDNTIIKANEEIVFFMIKDIEENKKQGDRLYRKIVDIIENDEKIYESIKNQKINWI